MHLLIRFAVEVAAVAAFGVWGWRAGTGVSAYALGIGAPAAMIVAWGLFTAPKALFNTPPMVREGLAMGVFALAAEALYLAGEPLLAMVLIVVAVLNSVQLRVYGLRG